MSGGDNEMKPLSDRGATLTDKLAPAKSGIVKESASQAKEQSDAIFADWWRIMLKRTGLVEMVSGDSARTLRWIEAHIGIERLVLDDASRRQLHETLDAPLPGPADGMSSLVGGLAKQLHAYSPDAWRRFLRGRLAATLRRLEEEGAEPETRLDVLLNALQPARGMLGARFLLPILPEAYRELQTQLHEEPHRREAGFYKTWGALADLLTKESDPRLLHWARFLYGALLVELAEQGQFARKRRIDRAWLEIIETDANNLASVLDDLREYENTQCLLQVSAAASLAAQQRKDRTPAEGEDEAIAAAIAPFLEGSVHRLKGVPRDQAGAVTSLFGVPRCWLPENSTPPEPTLLAPCLGALAAVYAVDAATESKATVALFNLANLLNRLEDEGHVQQSTAPARALVNAAGLRWALKDAGDFNELIVAANEHGIDCAVNLLGALADFERFSTDGLASLAEFASAMWMLRPFAANDRDFRRMEKSLEILGMESLNPDPQARGNPDSLRQMLDNLIASLTPAGCTASLESWRRFAAKPGADSLARLLVAVLRFNFCAEYPPALARALRVIEAVIALAVEPKALLDHFPDFPDALKKPSPPSEATAGPEAGDTLANLLVTLTSRITTANQDGA